MADETEERSRKLEEALDAWQQRPQGEDSDDVFRARLRAELERLGVLPPVSRTS